MTHVLTLPENKEGRDFVVGDIHGTFKVLDRALEDIGFDREKDRLIAVGDLINLGPDSAGARKLLAKPWFYSVCGNHENFFLRVCNAKGEVNKAALGERTKWLRHAPKKELAELRAEIEKLPIVIEIQTARGTVGVVHGEVPPGMDWATFKEAVGKGKRLSLRHALAGRKRIQTNDTRGVPGIDRIFCGHTPQQDGTARLGNCYYIDTGSVRHWRSRGNSRHMLTLGDITAVSSAFLRAAARGTDDYATITQTPERATKPFPREYRAAL